MILSELIQRALDIASNGQDTSVTRLADEIAVEPQLLQVFDAVSRNTARNPAKRSLLRRTNSVTFVNGVGVLPQTILTPYLCESLLYDTADLTARYAWVSQFSELITTHDMRLGYYSVNESSIYVVQPGANYVQGSGLSGALSLVTPCDIVVPAVAAAVVVRDELLEDLIAGLATALRAKATI